MSALDTVLAAARAELGSRYVYGAEGPDTFDCSGLTQYVYGVAGISLPRTAAQQQKSATRVSTPRPGDLVFYGSPATHVGIYVGDGKMIDAPHTGDVVKVQSVYGSPTYGRVPGVAAATGVATAALASLGGAVNTALGIPSMSSVRALVVEAAFVVLGLAVVGIGVVRTAAPAARRALS